jgi:tellurite resistance protein TerC
MTVPVWVWVATIAAVVAVVAADLVLDRRPREVSLREAGLWTTAYLLLAAAFAAVLLGTAGGHVAGQFVAGFLVEYSLSIDNLFVFVVILGAFSVPRALQHRVLLIGVILALLLRAVFIVAGANLVQRFEWLLLVFGVFLLVTAWRLLRHRGDQPEHGDNAAVRALRRVVPMAGDYAGNRLHIRRDGRRVFTPLLLVFVAIGTTDLLFALDSIPAVFGLTREPYLIFTANAFALLGLRQLYFLLDGLLDRLRYLPYGLAVVLGFIGLKLIAEALHAQGVGWAPQLPTLVSLGVIIGVLATTAAASLIVARRRDPVTPGTTTQ